ncbi:hypothetical protein [Mangrovibrevibacter kandeliae]|uniref:hypothetical protein n=1 Tax=Mangrovibrevibacter kandeliae TaxID=2968473 RepID=UPI002118DB93|nr:hypothetical protein [Aurantimonas sp. CSK15Z-1]MCQ8781737.1 hypothetical protein [Aurantimonas sp. CSK15Z-1]
MPIQAPYTTGTATVTAGSAIVTGTGTTWAISLVNGGLFSSGGVSIPILSVESDTQLTLAYPWPDTTGTSAYAIDMGRAEAAFAITTAQRLAETIAILSDFSPLARTFLDAEDSATALAALGVSSFAQSLLDDLNASIALSTLGVSSFAKTLLDDANSSTALTTLGVSNFAKTFLDDADGWTVLTTLGATNFGKTLLVSPGSSSALSTLGVSDFGKTLLDDADAGTALTTLGVSAFAKTILGAADGAAARATLGITTELPPGSLYGMTLATSGGDVTVTTGRCRSFDITSDIVLSSNMTKSFGPWSAGSGAGGLDAGSAADGTYHVFAIMRTDNGAVDVLLSTSATSPTMPGSYNRRRRIGSVVRSGGAVLLFVQDGDRFWYTNNPMPSVSNTNVPSANGLLLSLPVPTGIGVDVVYTYWWADTNSNNIVWMSSPLVPDLGVSATAGRADKYGTGSGGQKTLRTNTSGQIRARGSGGSTGQLYIMVDGWVDARGRFGGP